MNHSDMPGTKSVVAFIGMGSNLGDGLAILQGAWQVLAQMDGIVCLAISSPYTSEPVDMKSQHWFTNAVGMLETTLEPIELLRRLMAIEADFGRKRDKKVFGLQDRSLDLDLLYYGDLILDIPDLILPHPRLAERLFVLDPLAEIAPDFIDCVQRKKFSALREELSKRLTAGQAKGQELFRISWERQ